MHGHAVSGYVLVYQQIVQWWIAALTGAVVTLVVLRSADRAGPDQHRLVSAAWPRALLAGVATAGLIGAGQAGWPRLAGLPRGNSLVYSVVIPVWLCLVVLLLGSAAVPVLAGPVRALLGPARRRRQRLTGRPVRRPVRPRVTAVAGVALVAAAGSMITGSLGSVTISSSDTNDTLATSMSNMSPSPGWTTPQLRVSARPLPAALSHLLGPGELAAVQSRFAAALPPGTRANRN